MPAAFGGTGFQPVRRTGKMPVPPRTFRNRIIGRSQERLCHQHLWTKIVAGLEAIAPLGKKGGGAAVSGCPPD